MKIDFYKFGNSNKEIGVILTRRTYSEYKYVLELCLWLWWIDIGFIRSNK